MQERKMIAKVITRFILLTIVVSSGLNAAFPDDPKPCKYGDVECISKLVNYFAAQKYEGDEAIDLVSVDPLEVKKLHISRGGDGPVNIDLMLTNGTGLGLRTAKFVNMTGFNKEIATKHEIVAKAEMLHLLADYTIKGKMLILPLVGTGKSNFTLIEPVFTFGWVGIPYEKDGATYMKLDKHYVDVDPKGLIFNFDNLFNDKALSDNTNKFLTENWKELYPEIRGSLGHGYSLITRKLFNRVFAKYPYDKYFMT